MVGAAAMGPQPFTVAPKEDETEEQAHRRILDRFEKIGLQIMNRTGGGPFTQDPIGGVLGDPAKRSVAAQILGQAYVTAHVLMLHNRHAVDHVADALLAKRELFGDDLLTLLESATVRIPEVDLNDEAVWPPVSFSAQVGSFRGPAPVEAPTNGRPVP
jgi:hypothetical protein